MMAAGKSTSEEAGEFKMKVEFLEKGDNKIRFILNDVDEVFVNTLRRNILSNVPTMAVDEVTFQKNNSALFDEMLAHRLGLVVFKTDLKSYNLKEECKCKGEGCAKCQLHVSLKAKGPCTVYASDIKTMDPKVQPVYPKTIIVKLLKNQELQLDSIATLGRGKTHAKYTPGWVYYQGVPEVKILKSGNVANAIKVCPTNVFTDKGGSIKVKDEMKCILCMACVDACGDENINVKGSKTDFIVTIESYGQLKINELINAAFEGFDEKLDQFADALEKI